MSVFSGGSSLYEPTGPGGRSLIFHKVAAGHQIASALSMKNVSAVVLLVAAAAPLTAQRLEPRFSIGRTTFADDGPIHHLTAGGSLRTYLSRRWSFEPEFLYMRNNDYGRDRDYLLWGNFSVDILNRDRRVVPYWFAAPGLIHHRSSFGSWTVSSTEAAFGTGVGARIFITDRVFVGPQFRLGFAEGIFAEITGSIGFVLKK